MTIFIGDVHGKYEPYKRIMKMVDSTIQVGDMGVGFRRSGWPEDDAEYGNPPHAKMVAGNHRFIRGNHDNPAACKRHSQWIADGTVEGNMMLIGGAVSIDAAFRREGYSWWPDEELSQEELDALVEKYLQTKPEVMVTHDCPEDIAQEVFLKKLMITPIKDDFPSRTRVALQRMWSMHQPKLWVHGHWHVSSDVRANGTRFVCLAELEARDLEP